MEDFFLFLAVGFCAQMVDGAIGMAYGLISTSILISTGVPPVTASASIHAAEIFTTGVSGFSHWKMGNVDKELLKRLVPFGVIGGIIGAYILSSVDGDGIKIFVTIYLFIMGLLVLWRAWQKIKPSREVPKHVSTLGFVGGFMDAIGGGGWGPVVTSTLLGTGTTPRYAIGSVSLAEFFITLSVSLTFIFTIGFKLWPIIAGLIIGGVIAAPLAARIVKKVDSRRLMFFVGAMICLLSLNSLRVALA